MLTVNNKTYTKKDLLRIGNNVASMWGGSCYDVFIDETKDKEIMFECVEHGEFFVTSISFEDLKEYDY